MAQNVIATEELIDQIYHSEDGELRTEGLWPEYAYTMSICVDSYRDGVAFGRIHNYFYEQDKHFCTLDQILFAIEEILDSAHVAQKSTVMREEIKSREAAQRRGYSSAELQANLYSEEPVRQEPFYPFDGLRVKKGAVANFRIRIVSRYHSSMQGTISMDRKGRDAATGFRSALELLHMLYHSLEEATR